MEAESRRIEVKARRADREAEAAPQDGFRGPAGKAEVGSRG